MPKSVPVDSSHCDTGETGESRGIEETSSEFPAVGERPSEQSYLGLLEHLTDFVFSLDLEGRLLSINRTAAMNLGYEPREVIGEPIEKIIAPSERKFVPEMLRKVMEAGNTEGVSEYQAKNGSTHFLEYSFKLINLAKRPCCMVGVARDITDRVLAKKALRETEAKSRILVQNAHDGIAFVDAKGRIQFANRRLKEILKDPHPEGRPVTDYYDKHNRAILDEHLLMRKEGKSSTYFITLMDLEGVPHDMVVSGTPHVDRKGQFKGSIGVHTDITRLKKLDDQLQQSQKLQAIGTLAGGIAHDFNNILSAVLGYASLLRKNAPPGSQLAHYAEMIEKSAERGSELSGKLLAFSREGKQCVRDVDVHKVMDDLVEILNHTFDRNITIAYVKDAKQPIVEGDPGQIQQLLMNLCINAKDAMPGGGALTLITDTMDIDEAFCRDHDGLMPGVFLRISVKDTGVGITEAVKRHLFEPFFTTKEEGKGTGLGLAMVYGAVKNHGGMVEVQSEPSCGSLFTVMLPLKKGPAAATAPVESKEPDGCTGTILVVDDEPIIRELVPEILAEAGFRPIIARDGREALEIYADCWRHIDLVILDMIMPGMNGRETFRALKRINPEIRALLSTGFSADGPAEEALDEGILGLVRKPYRPEQLCEAICRAMSCRSV